MMNAALPIPDVEAITQSHRLSDLILADINTHGGWISFARYMALSLYTPGLGYYSGGARKFGAAGDFVTAPELGPVFAHTLAMQVVQVMQASAPRILEVGAGSGRLAADLLSVLDAQGHLPDQYAILELSGDLRARQQAVLQDAVPHLMPRLLWLDTLPQTFEGLVLANEVLDAMPVHQVCWRSSGISERGVAADDSSRLVWAEQAAQGLLLERAMAIAERGIACGADAYVSEISLAIEPWLRTWANILQQGALLLLDYGFPRHEFYHPQRTSGTLMCHYRHYAHSDPFYWPGLQDITAHVDFTGVAEAATDSGLDWYGYTSQAHFLFNCGLTQVMTKARQGKAQQDLRWSSAAQKLISPAEMGELFKVVAVGRGIHEPLIGFVKGDQSHKL